MTTYKIFKTDTRKSLKTYPSKDTIDFFSAALYTLEHLVKKFIEKEGDNGHIIEHKNKSFKFEFSNGETFELFIMAV